MTHLTTRGRQTAICMVVILVVVVVMWIMGW